MIWADEWDYLVMHDWSGRSTVLHPVHTANTATRLTTCTYLYVLHFSLFQQLMSTNHSLGY